MITLTKAFTRERSHFYMRVWQDSDRLGLSEWIGHDIRTSLFLRSGATNRMSVWYDYDEFEMVETTIEELFAAPNGSDLFARMEEQLEQGWKLISSYLSGTKSLSSIEEFEQFYHDVVSWWSVMSIFFLVPDLEEIPENLRDRALNLRLKVEKFSDKIDDTLLSFWITNFPQYKDAAFVLSPEEAVELSRLSEHSRDLAEIEKRKDGFALLNGELYLVSAFEKVLAEKDLALNDETVERTISELKGSPASPGKGTGKVRLLLLKEQVPQLQEGEVLVTEMTNPDFVPAMKKAAAIVTDEGGITCHAAIASRELNKPCVIGTKIATQVLKDGDEVEVDADNGVVRKLHV